MPLCPFCETHRDALSCIILTKKQQRVQKEAFGLSEIFQRDQLDTFDVCEIFSETKWILLVSVKFSDRPNGSFWCL